MYSKQQEKKDPIKNGASCPQYKNGNYYRVYKLKDPLVLRKQDNFQIRVNCKFYWKTKIYNLEWII